MRTKGESYVSIIAVKAVMSSVSSRYFWRTVCPA